MPSKKRPDPKIESLRDHGGLNPHPETVADPLFQEEEFFDSRDLVQVKYEMLRRVQKGEQSASQAAQTFGFSRPSLYLAKKAFEREGVAGLIHKKRGPRGAHKLTEPVLTFLRRIVEAEGHVSPAELAQRIEERFAMTIHPRTLERALKSLTRKKKRQ